MAIKTSTLKFNGRESMHIFQTCFCCCLQSLGFIAVCLGIIGSYMGQPDGVSHMPPAFILGVPSAILAYLSKNEALFLKKTQSPNPQ